jgi:hypothetical protein
MAHCVILDHKMVIKTMILDDLAGAAPNATGQAAQP